MFDFSRNFFQLFGLPENFRVDPGQLQARYRELQKAVHPDRYANASEHERRIALQFATRVNEALQTLRQPLLRAQYMLHLRGVDTTGRTSTHDAAFLMQQMEMREQLAELRTQADPEAELDRLMRRIGAMRKGIIEVLAAQLGEGDAFQAESAQDSVRKLQFLDKLLSEAEAVEAELEEID